MPGLLLQAAVLCITIDKSYLYGSYLSNTATDESDIDVMIVTENEDDYLTGKIWSLTRKVNIKIEPYLVGKKKFADNEDSPLIDLPSTRHFSPRLTHPCLPASKSFYT